MNNYTLTVPVSRQTYEKILGIIRSGSVSMTVREAATHMLTKAVRDEWLKIVETKRDQPFTVSDLAGSYRGAMPHGVDAYLGEIRGEQPETTEETP